MDKNTDDPTIPIDIERLKTLLDESPYKQNELAQIMHISESEFSKWKLGVRGMSRSQIIRISTLLYCNPGWLIGVDDKRTPNGHNGQYELATLSSTLPLVIRSSLLTLVHLLSEKSSGNFIEEALTLFVSLVNKMYIRKSKRKPSLPE